jgi:hypothetical protein
MKPSTEFEALLKNVGVSLQNPGLNEVGLVRADALRAVGLLRSARIAILGGDVYLRQEGHVRPWSPNSWSFNANPGENHEAYLQRSWDRAEAYIKTLPQPKDAEPLFAIVPGT